MKNVTVIVLGEKDAAFIIPLFNNNNTSNSNNNNK